VTTAVSVGINTGGALELFAPAPGGAIVHTFETAPNSTTWSAWASLG
jgi:hypothetical protein